MNWLEIEIDSQGEDLTVLARGSRGECPAPQELGMPGTDFLTL